MRGRSILGSVGSVVYALCKWVLASIIVGNRLLRLPSGDLLRNHRAFGFLWAVLGGNLCGKRGDKLHFVRGWLLFSRSGWGVFKLPNGHLCTVW